MNIAVIISLYYGESAYHFKRSIASILSQRQLDGVNVRIYLGVDGPLSVELEEAVRSLSGSFYKLVRHERNRGLVFVLNDLIGLLEDEALIFRMDTDDFALPLRFFMQIQYLEKHPEVDILGTSIIERNEITGNRRIVNFAKGPLDAVKRLPRGVPVAHPTVCFRARVLQKTGGYPPVRNNEDIAMWFACAREGFKFDNIREPLYEFSINDNFWKRRGLRKSLSEFVVYLKGIWSLGPMTVDYVYPLCRLILRLSPKRLQQYAYNSGLRDIQADRKNEIF